MLYLVLIALISNCHSQQTRTQMEQNDNKQNRTEVNSIKDQCQEDNDDDDVFHFESEHLALRGNQSYSNLLRTIAMLQAQRIRVHQQIDELEKTRDLYLANPQLLLEKLASNEPLIAPNYLNVVTLPELPCLTVPEDVKLEATKANQSTHESDKDNKNGKAKTFLWTNEEQRRLEQLLIEFPPEEVEMRRFGKIAKALGNRTAQQVFSRVQKYFQKLHDAGLPVPGRLPKYRRAGVFLYVNLMYAVPPSFRNRILNFTCPRMITFSMI